MGFVRSETSGTIATLTLDRGKVNAINGQVVGDLREAFRAAETDPKIRAVVLSGSGPFFSFGFDVPELYPLPMEAFRRFLEAFTEFYADLFLFPKPVVAALNGHTIAGGCMLALACDHRVMASGRAKISLNEIDIGASLFAGSVEMLRFWVGNARASAIVTSGNMFDGGQALALGLVEEIAEAELVYPAARDVALRLAAKDAEAFRSLKRLLRAGCVEEWRRREADSLTEFVEIWYSEATRAKLASVTIRG